jgi:hypothetical protein
MDSIHYGGIKIRRENKNSAVMAFLVIMDIMDIFIHQETLFVDFALFQETASLVTAAVRHILSLWMKIPDFFKWHSVLDYKRVHRFLYYDSYPYH